MSTPWSVVKTWTPWNPPQHVRRRASVQQRYQQHKQQLQQQGLTVADYVRREYLGMRRAVFMVNPFPYDVSGCRHWLLWLNPIGWPLPTVDDVRCVLDRLVSGKYSYFQNLPANRTVPDIPHYHVFVKNV